MFLILKNRQLQSFLKLKFKNHAKRIQNSFCSIEISFEFFLNVAIYDMKTDGKKSEETFQCNKELKKRKQ